MTKIALSIFDDNMAPLLRTGDVIIVDTDAERERLTKELQNTENEIKRAQGKLNNAEFVAKAPEKVVNAEKEKLQKFQELAEKLRASIASL